MGVFEKRIESENKNEKRVYPECLSFENEMRVTQMSDVNDNESFKLSK